MGTVFPALELFLFVSNFCFIMIIATMCSVAILFLLIYFGFLPDFMVKDIFFVGFGWGFLGTVLFFVVSLFGDKVAEAFDLEVQEDGAPSYSQFRIDSYLSSMNILTQGAVAFFSPLICILILILFVAVMCPKAETDATEDGFGYK